MNGGDPNAEMITTRGKEGTSSKLSKVSLILLMVKHSSVIHKVNKRINVSR